MGVGGGQHKVLSLFTRSNISSNESLKERCYGDDSCSMHVAHVPPHRTCQETQRKPDLLASLPVLTLDLNLFLNPLARLMDKIDQWDALITSPLPRSHANLGNFNMNKNIGTYIPVRRAELQQSCVCSYSDENHLHYVDSLTEAQTLLYWTDLSVALSAIYNSGFLL